jgi:hypothetical protein
MKSTKAGRIAKGKCLHAAQGISKHIAYRTNNRDGGRPRIALICIESEIAIRGAADIAISERGTVKNSALSIGL